MALQSLKMMSFCFKVHIDIKCGIAYFVHDNKEFFLIKIST